MGELIRKLIKCILAPTACSLPRNPDRGRKTDRFGRLYDFRLRSSIGTIFSHQNRQPIARAVKALALDAARPA
jgi:hypothetical protein